MYTFNIYIYIYTVYIINHLNPIFPRHRARDDGGHRAGGYHWCLREVQLFGGGLEAEPFGSAISEMWPTRYGKHMGENTWDK
jgi:hypothetical protein